MSRNFRAGRGNLVENFEKILKDVEQFSIKSMKIRCIETHPQLIEIDSSAPLVFHFPIIIFSVTLYSANT